MAGLKYAESQNCSVNIQMWKATGPDNIGNTLLTNYHGPFANFTKICIENGELPKMWEACIIKPLPKKAILNVRNDYRPVALTSSVMKCLKKNHQKGTPTLQRQRKDSSQFAYERSNLPLSHVRTSNH